VGELMGPIPKCATCFDVSWVCENHPTSPWDTTSPAGCECGAGMPCPKCNPADADNPPRAPTGFKPGVGKEGSRH
jgi:hypothetical protein